MATMLRRRQPTSSRRAGAGEPVLLIHPFMLSHHSWRPVVDHLSQGHDVLAVTMPGHYGGPPVPWRGATIAHLVDHVEQQLDRAGWQTAHVVGNSLGGWAALELGLRGRARSVTAIAPAGGYDGFLPRDLVMGLAFVATATARTGLRATTLLPQLPLRRLALRALAHDPSLVDPATARHVALTALGATHPLQVLLACIRSIPARRLEELEVPVHLVFAEHDLVIPPRLYAAYFTERLAHARVTHLPGVGHCPQVEAPETVAELVRETVAWAARAHLAEAR